MRAAQPAPQWPIDPLSMGKVLGGGSSINVMVWARGHKNDRDFFASEAGDKAWSYQSVLNIYRRIEDWHGSPDPDYRGTGGPVYVEPAPDPNPLAPAGVQGAHSVGIPTFENQNGRMMEGAAARRSPMCAPATDTANRCSVLTFPPTWTGPT